MIYLGNKPVGVGYMPCGSFTKHVSMTAAAESPNSALEFTNPLGVVPKLVVVKRDTLTTSRISSVVISTEANIGGVLYGNSSGVATGTSYDVVSEYTGNYKTAYLGANVIQLAKITSSIGYTATDYNVDIYA